MKHKLISVFLCFLSLATYTSGDDEEVSQAAVSRQNALLREIADIFNYRNSTCEDIEVFTENLKKEYKGKSILQFPFFEILMVRNADRVSIKRAIDGFDVVFENDYNYSHFVSLNIIIISVSFGEDNEIDWIRILMSLR